MCLASGLLIGQTKPIKQGVNMEQSNNSGSSFEETLRDIQKAGIHADNMHIKRDMCAQFSDPNEWIREYVVNSYDAQATRCRIWAEGKEGEVTVFVSDDGHGMNKQGVIDFCTLYRSRKKMEPRKTVGQFGIGKLSVAAIPGQKKFKLKTSTGSECWIVEAGNLISEDPINIYSTGEVSPQGTLFEVTFSTKESPEDVMLKLSKILRKYTLYLPIAIELIFFENPETGYSGGVEKICQDWSCASENYGQSFNFALFDQQYEVILGIGAATHEVYQNKVLISDKYNLVTYDLTNKIQLPNLRIRINSSSFQLPFGRHCLRNENVLGPVSKKIRDVIIPQYFDFLLQQCEIQHKNSKGLERKVEELAVFLVIHLPDHGKKWSHIPLFRIFPNQRVSFIQLDNLITEVGKVYLEESENTGVDYTFFDAPVLLQDQPHGSAEFLKKCYHHELINLSFNDVVIEIPNGAAAKLSQEEINFETNLGFDDDFYHINKKSRFEQDFDGSNLFGEAAGFGFSDSNNYLSEFDQPDVKKVIDAFKQLRWRANYLVTRDGKTPCITHRFLVDGYDIILNLYHQDVKDLVLLSVVAPKLAAHWAVAMCLSDENKILSYLSSESREDLMLADALIKAAAPAESNAVKDNAELVKMRNSIRILLRNSGFDFGRN
jgi:hypothetical protein